MSKNKFFATTATAALVASAIVPAAASAADLKDFDSVPGYAKEAVKFLADNDFVQGDQNQNFKPASTLMRAQAAEIIAKVLDLKATGGENFNDVKAGDWYYNAVVATSPEIFEGNEKGNFNPTQDLTRQEAAQIIVKAFDLTGSKDLSSFADASKVPAWAKSAFETAVANGVINGKGSNLAPQDNITNAEFAVMIKRAIDAAAPAVTKVASVEAVNAKTIEVKFNNAIDEETLKNASDVDVITVVASEGARDAGTITQELSEDGKTLTLKAQNIFKGDYTVKVPFEIVKDENGEFVSPTNSKVTVDDKTAPVVTSATTKIKDTKDGIKNITLTFDEEVASIDTVKINGTNYSAAVNGNEATVEVDLDATKEYELTVVNATDFAGNVKDMQKASLNVKVDNVAPSIVSVVAAGENQVKVTVDEELVDNTLAISAKVGTFDTNIVAENGVKVNPENNKEYIVTLNNSYLFKNGNSDTVTLTVAKDALADELGNTNAAEITKTVEVSKDVTAPKVVKVATSKTEGKVSSFTLTYDEEVKNVNDAKIKVVNSKGEILTATDVVSNVQIKADDAKVVVFTLEDVDTDKYNFELEKGFVTDKALTANESAKYAFNIDVTEDGQPVETTFNIVGATVSEVAENVITVDFGAKVKATGTGSALNPSAYQVNGVTLPSDTKIAFGKDAENALDQSKVVITLPAGFVKADDDKAMFRVNGVQTLDNKVSNQFSTIIEVADNTAPEAKSFVATDLTKITVTYSEAITVVDTNNNGLLDEVKDEISLVDNKGVAITITGATVVEGKLVLTVADATKVESLTTLAVAEGQTANITDLQEVAQKAKVTITKK